MFSGIVSAIGKIVSVELRSGGVRLTVEVDRLFDLMDVALGDSIAINGACMTVISKTDTCFQVDVSDESLRCTVGLDGMAPVNLEKSLRLADRLGGHLVSGHVDAVGTVELFEPRGDSWCLSVRVPESLVMFLAYKGSVTVQGVSLTVNHVEDAVFSVNLIPHTIHHTTLQFLAVGSRVNIEVDLIARYCERMLSYQNAV